MKKNSHKLNIIVTALFLAAVTPVLLFAKRPSTSETERRNLTPFPKFTVKRLFSGKFTKELNLYFSDTVPMRDELSEKALSLKGKWGVNFDGVKLHIADKKVDRDAIARADNNAPSKPKPPAPPPKSPEQTQPVPTETDKPAWDGIIRNSGNDAEEGAVNVANDGIIVYKNRGLMLAGWVSKAGERYAKAMNEYARVFNEASEKEVNVYSLVAPTAIEFYCPGNYLKEVNIDQMASINNINSFLENVIPVNAYSALSAKTKEDIYMRTDHHWAALGAYYAAEEFAAAADVPFKPLSEYEQVTIPGYVGTMYGFSDKDPEIGNYPEDFVYYKPNNNYDVTYNIIHKDYDPLEDYSLPLFIKQPLSDSYSTFLGGDVRISHITTDVENDRVLAIFKDSYGNAFAPFMTNSFKEIYVIDIRYFPYNAVDYLTARGVTDILFVNNIAVANDGHFIEMIENLIVS